MTPETYIAYLAVLAVFFLGPPGPSQVLMISHSLRHGVRRAGATVAGDLSANALQMTAAAFGLAAVIATSQTALWAVKWAGVAYLVWMGVRTWRTPSPELGQGSAAAVAPRRLYRQGFVTSGTNPEAVFFFAALFPQFIDPTAPIWPQLLILGGTYLVADGVLLLVLGGLARRLLGWLGAAGRRLNQVSGGLMIAAAGLLALRDVEVRQS